MTSLCNFPIGWLDGHHRLENPKAKDIVWLQIYFGLKNVRRTIPLKRFSENDASKFITARNESRGNFILCS